ncbi:hypothetical protein HDU98_006820 [Podochytrium sp. JEL0797]|nr:hypothetical protein HDU98_006820 [Podochytrium sp. JEL0797]
MVGVSSAGFIVLVGAADTPFNNTNSIHILNPSPTGSLHLSDVHAIQGSSDALVTGSFRGESLSLPKSGGGEEVVVKGGVDSVVTFVARVSGDGFLWAVGAETVKGVEALGESVSVQESGGGGEEKKGEEAGAAIQVDPPTSTTESASVVEHERRSGSKDVELIKFPSKLSIDTDGNVLVAGTFVGVLDLGLSTKLESPSNVFDGFVSKLNIDSGNPLAAISGFSGLTEATPKSPSNSVFLATSLQQDPCSKYASSYILTGQSFSTESLTAGSLRNKITTSHLIRITAKSATEFEVGKKSFKVLGALTGPISSASVNPDTDFDDDWMNSVQVVALGETEEKCGYFVSGVEAVDTASLAFKDPETEYKAFVGFMSDDFVLPDSKKGLGISTFVSHEAVWPPSIAVISSELAYISGAVKDSKLDSSNAVDGTPFAESAPFNYLLAVDPSETNAWSKTPIPHPPQLAAFEGLPRAISASLSIRPSSEDCLLAFGGLDAMNKDGTVGAPNRGAWVGILDLRHVVAYSEGFAPSAGGVSKEKVETEHEKGVEVAPSVVETEKPVEVLADPLPSPTTSAIATPTKSSLYDDVPDANEDEVVEIPSKPPAKPEKVPEAPKKPVLPPPKVEEEEEEDIVKHPAFGGGDPSLEVGQADDTYYLPNGFFTISIFVAIALVGIFFFYISKKGRPSAESGGGGGGGSNAFGSLLASLHQIFNPSPRGDYEAAMKNDDDESLIGMSSLSSNHPRSPLRDEGPVTPIPKGRNILPPVLRKPSVDAPRITPVVLRKPSMDDSRRNDTVIAMGSMGAQESAVPFTEAAESAWDDWDGDDFGDDAPLATDVARTSKDGKEGWGWDE